MNPLDNAESVRLCTCGSYVNRFGFRKSIVVADCLAHAAWKCPECSTLNDHDDLLVGDGRCSYCAARLDSLVDCPECGPAFDPDDLEEHRRMWHPEQPDGVTGVIGSDDV